MSNDDLPNHDESKRFLWELLSSPQWPTIEKKMDVQRFATWKEHWATPGRSPASFLAFFNLTAYTIKCQITKCQILYLLLKWIGYAVFNIALANRYPPSPECKFLIQIFFELNFKTFFSNPFLCDTLARFPLSPSEAFWPERPDMSPVWEGAYKLPSFP